MDEPGGRSAVDGLVARIERRQRGATVLAVESGGERVATALVSRGHRPIRHTSSQRGAETTGAWSAVQAPATLPAPRDAPHPDPVAWPAAQAAQAAAQRWSDPHPALRSVTALLQLDGAVPPPAILEAIGAELAGHGIRRLDLRIPAADPLGPTLVGSHWMQGRVGADVVASLATAYPWTDAPDPDSRLTAVLAPLPPRVRRAVRRTAAVRPGQVPELIRSTSTEAAAAVRQRYRPRLNDTPVDAAPDGSSPFQASRYRTVRATFSFVPEPLRRAPFVDIGVGDGRVLREALDFGFPWVTGSELDPGLAQRAQDAIGGAGQVTAGDALAAPIPDDAQVVYLNHPFGPDGVDRLAGLLADTLARRPRPLVVLYLNPRPIEPLLAAGLALVHADPRFSVFATTER
ncbi:MAG TPA: class I SAM-dependent methyltransferase [Acidimicrobiales bacterium]|nr:class I SAM-dependent methyltransferase [Acidimicrobiales bacterium]